MNSINPIPSTSSPGKFTPVQDASKIERTCEIWLKNIIQVSPQLNERTRLMQLIAVINAEIKFLEAPNEWTVSDIPENISMGLLESVSPLLFSIKENSGNSARLTAHAEAHKEGKKLFLQYLIDFRRQLPYPEALCQSIENVLKIFSTKSSKEISTLFPHDQFSTFLNCISPFLYNNIHSVHNLVELDILYERIQAFFYTTTEPNQMLTLLKAQMVKWLANAAPLNYAKHQTHVVMNLSFCQQTPAKRINDVSTHSQNLASWQSFENTLIMESEIMDSLAARQINSLKNYPKYTKLLHLKYRNTKPMKISNNKVYLYPIEQKSWHKLNDTKLLTDYELKTLRKTISLVSICGEKAYFLYLDPDKDKATEKTIKYLNVLRKQAPDPSVRLACDSLMASIGLMQRNALDEGFFTWIESIYAKPVGVNSTLTPFIYRLQHLYSVIPIVQYNDKTSPTFFSLFFQATLDILISNWSLYREDQQKLLNYAKEQIEALKTKKILKAQEKKSRLKKMVTTVRHIAETAKKPKQTVITPNSIQTLQQQLLRPASNIVTAPMKRIESAFPGKEPQFQKHQRVSKWELQTVKFLDPFSMELEEELLQHIFHIPHPLVDRFIHLGIKDQRDALDCITIPAEITINDVISKGSIGYTFTAQGLCFHRHFTRNTIEKQKKEAVSYVHFPEIGHANAKPLPSAYIPLYKCWITEDEAANVTMQHKQVAYYAGEKKEYAVSIKLFNVH